MSPETIIANLPQALMYLTFAVIAGSFILSKLAEASESFSKVFGPLGRFWRRKIDAERQERLESFREEARRAVDSELGVARKAEYASLKQQLIDVLDRVAEMERNEAIYEAYLVSDGEWHRQINIRLAELGMLQAPLPDRVPFSEFEETYRTSRGWPKR